MQIQVHKEVDARGLNCPLPILRAKKALADMESGQILKVLATDRNAISPRSPSRRVMKSLRCRRRIRCLCF
jgi:TusA-related sulfurtransferase